MALPVAGDYRQSKVAFIRAITLAFLGAVTISACGGSSEIGFGNGGAPERVNAIETVVMSNRCCDRGHGGRAAREECCAAHRAGLLEVAEGACQAGWKLSGGLALLPYVS